MKTYDDNVCNKMNSALLQEYLEGTIDPVEKLFVEGHLNICKTCRRELSELKLMFWELGRKSNFDIDFPEELDTLAAVLIDSALGMERKSSTRKVVDMQINNMKMSQKFLDYLPGARQTPEILKKASKGLAKGVSKGVKKGVKKILAAR